MVNEEVELGRRRGRGGCLQTYSRAYVQRSLRLSQAGKVHLMEIH